MNVGVALHYVRAGKITGVERLGLSLVSGLRELETAGVQIHVLASATAAHQITVREGVMKTVLPGDWRLFGEQVVLPVWSALRRLDVLHIPAFAGALIQPVPFVLTIHDAVFWEMPSSLSTLGRIYYRPLIERAIKSRHLRATLYPSTASRDAVLKYFPSLARSAHVCPNAISLPRAAKPRRWHNRADGPLRVLTVGTIEPRKNLTGMVQAISQLATRTRQRVRWQLVGRKGWARSQEEAVLGHPSVEWLGAVDDDQLVDLYRQADLYLTLSHLEGFNIPVVEAMAQGTPVVASDLAVHREIAADGAEYVPANDASTAATAMHALLATPDRWDMRATAAWQRSAVFTQQALAARVLDVYRSACN
jgi:glycosyltransferase involved in cell wall biosynthesis